MGKHTLKTIVSPVVKSGDVFPEQKLPGMQVTEDSVAVCISGGGSRAFSCAVGYLRALNELGFLSEAKYICAVSGGSWASSIFTFTDMPETDLLGAHVEASSINMDFLKAPHGKMTTAISSDRFNAFETAAELLVEGKTDLRNLWETTIGHEMLKPFGLDKKLFALNEEYINDIVKRNPFLKKEDFLTPQPGRPFLVMNGTLDGPVHATATLSALQMTPLYVGCPYYQKNEKVTYTMPSHCCGLWPERTRKYIVGGGFVETFAFGCKQPKNKSQQSGGPCECPSPDKEGLFKLERAVGISSCAYAMKFKEEKHGLLRLAADLVDPVEQYWPVLSGKFPGPQRSMKFQCGDGGSFENTALLSALQRGIRKAVVFINTSSKLFNDPDLSGNDELVPIESIDDQFTCLFGILKETDSWDYSENQVFPESELEVVLKQMKDSYKKGIGAFAHHKKLPLLENPFWNIKGGYDVEVIFVYNENALEFRNQLPSDTKAELNKKHEGRLHNYPHYDTMFNNGLDGIMALYIEQINLLAATTEFVVRQHKTDFTQLFQK